MEVIESRKNTRLPSSASEQPISIGYLSKLPSTWNSDGMKNGIITTQGVVPMSNVRILDHTDNGNKTSIHLSIVVVSEGNKIVKNLGNNDMMSHEHGKRHSPAKEMPDKHLGNRDMMNYEHCKGYYPAKEMPDDKSPLAIHTNMIILVTDLGNNDTNLHPQEMSL